MNKDLVFKALLLTRVILPPIIFSVFHPFIAMLFNECVLDGIVSPDHFFKDYIPRSVRGKHKLKYDIVLDSWGFLNGLIPVLYSGNKFYQVFEGKRTLILSLFLWKLIGNIVIYRSKNYKYALVFQNFYLSVYLATSFFDFFKIRENKGKIMAIFILVFVLREIFIVSMNKEMYPFPV